MYFYRSQIIRFIGGTDTAEDDTELAVAEAPREPEKPIRRPRETEETVTESDSHDASERVALRPNTPPQQNPSTATPKPTVQASGWDDDW